MRIGVHSTLLSATLLGALCAALSGCAPPKQGQSQAKAPEVAAPFVNAGGMWMPEQMQAHAQTLKKLGVKLDPAQLSDPQGAQLGSVVYLGGCSASFISADGLILTNHHCATSALQYSSTLRQNLTRDGFVAKSRADEKSNGPAARVYVTLKQSDVTDSVLRGLAEIPDDRARYLEAEKRRKALVKACEARAPHVRCQVSAYFNGAQQMLIERLEIQDVRLVYAPPAGIGNFGGEIDNWRWPRHSGDFTLLRTYVSEDGTPAAYAKTNVPYHPPQHLKISRTPLHAGDLVWVAGYPAHSDQLATPFEVDELVSKFFPGRIRYCEENVAAIEAASKNDPDAELKGYGAVRGLENWKKAMQGSLLGLSSGVAQSKRAHYQVFRDWVARESPAQVALLKQLEDTLRERVKSQARRVNFDELTGSSVMLQAAISIVRAAKERSKPDEERLAAYQERNMGQLRDQLASLDQRYAMKIDVARLQLALDRVARAPLTDRSAAFAVLGGEIAQPAARTKFIKGLFIGSTLVSKSARLKHLDSSWARLEKHWDPLLKVARQLLPAIEAQEAEDDAFNGKLLRIWPQYLPLLQTFEDGPIAPEANRTLRITFGQVKGYSPSPAQPEYEPFTWAGQIPAKHTGKPPFEAPGPLLEKIAALEFGDYADPSSGQVPVDFLADTHITGGNSGSPTFDARGNLVGVAFDGNYEALASNWQYMPELTRSIHVDIRYVLWLMSTVLPAPPELLAELEFAEPETAPPVAAPKKTPPPTPATK